MAIRFSNALFKDLISAFLQSIWIVASCAERKLVSQFSRGSYSRLPHLLNLPNLARGELLKLRNALVKLGVLLHPFVDDLVEGFVLALGVND